MCSYGSSNNSLKYKRAVAVDSSDQSIYFGRGLLLVKYSAEL